MHRDAVQLERRAARTLLGVTAFFIVLQPVLVYSASGTLRSVCGGWGLTPLWMYTCYALLGIGATMLPGSSVSRARRTAAVLLAAVSLIILGALLYGRFANTWSFLDTSLLDFAIAGRTCNADNRPEYAGMLAVGCLSLTLLLFADRRPPVSMMRDIALATGTALTAATAALHVLAGSGFGTFLRAPRTNAFASLMLLFIACAMGLYRSGPSPYQWLVQHGHRRIITRVLLIAALFPSSVLLGDSFFSDLGIDEQVSEAAAIGAATLFVAATVARFSLREERETQLRLDLAAELVRSEAHYRLLAENSVDVVAKFDAENRMEWVSPSVTAVLGWDPAELTGMRAEGLAHPDDFAATLMGREQLQSTGITAYRIRIRCKDGSYRWIGVRGRLVRDDAGRPSGVSASLRDIDHEVRVEQKLDKLARLDSLTGLMNRAEVYERIGALATEGSGTNRVAVLFCDMDNLKDLNDAYGHAAGDAVLRELAERILRCVRGADFVARIGGDEFLVVMPDIRDASEAEVLAERIRASAMLPIRYERADLQTTLSIGIALARPAEQVEATVMRADQAMYAAKTGGRNRVMLDTSFA